MPHGFSRRSRSALVALGFVALALALTTPLSLSPARFARLDGDGQFSIWNVAWVAHALTTSPLQVWDANIFHPETMTLAYSEANLLAGLLAIPGWLLTGSAHAAHNSVLLLSFVLNALAMFALVRYLTGDSGAAVVSGISFAFCPFVFAHLSHIQLLLTGGMPLAMLCFHRLADDPSPRRGVWLGAAMALQTYGCAYYGIFLVLMIAAAVVFTFSVQRRWADARLWTALAVAGVVAATAVLPLAWPYYAVTKAAGFGRPLDEAVTYSAQPGSYLASAAYAHQWLLSLLPSWRDVLFPGFVAAGGGLATLALAGRLDARQRHAVLLYGAIAALACWTSFGPNAWLYSALYRAVPGFEFLRAPVRFGVLVQLSLSTIAGIGISRWLATRTPARRQAWLVLPLAIVLAEAPKPVKFAEVPPLSRVYDVLAGQPRGAVLELPLYSKRFAFVRTRYMVNSTRHWQPLVGGYSDYIPASFESVEGVLGDFPSEDSLAVLRAQAVPYVVVHRGDYTAAQRASLDGRLASFADALQVVAEDADTVLYRVRPGHHPGD